MYVPKRIMVSRCGRALGAARNKSRRNRALLVGMAVALFAVMVIIARFKWTFCSLIGALLFCSSPSAGQTLPSGSALTCDRRVINAESYDLTTGGQAANLLAPRYDFWDRFRINRHIDALDDLNLEAWELAERARMRDPRNLMAHSILARQYLILGRERAAEDAWRTVMDHGGAVVWTATLYDVDSKSYFLMAFGRDALRIYRMGQFTGPITRHLGIAEFPPPDAVDFYEAVAGCPNAQIVPVTTIPWNDVNEIKAGNWVLWFKLAQPVLVTSDRNKKKSLREIKVNLHGETGHVEFLASPNPDYDPRWDHPSERWTNVRGIGLGPYDYQHRVRDMIVRFVDPTRRIRLTSSGRGAGW
jgi:fermentation-respiration switch protein FrsA (DUF1100 family)